MYLIHFKGKINPVEVENYEADRIKDVMLAPHKESDFLDIHGRLVSIKSISGMEPISSHASARLPEPKEEPLTEEQREALQAHIKKLGDEMRVKGIIGKKEKKYELEGVIWHKFCVECGEELPPGLARVCSSDCFRKQPI